ncbi:uncharacterized protein LOC123694501 isoform X1 [Colias croceus]|uniref:uncharacterized protein LOC123694501 isoform X1 n=1 Tax=Colias crocea TaxID=72248 RepID=UPI001E27DD67|nr:uncharacterized protein LOC123694501 isoform X1 [Colias croceus]
MKRILLILYLSRIIVSAYEIDVPKIFSVSALDPVGFFIKWTVVSSNSRDPVLGYKIRLWEVKVDSQGYLKLVNGEEMPGLLLEDRPLEIRLWKVEEDSQGYLNLLNGEETPGLLYESKPLEPMDKDKAPKGEPREEIVYNVDTRKAKIYNVKYNTLYEIRILAYKKDQEGPISEPARVKIMKGGNYFVVIHKRPEEACVVTIATNTTISGESYNHLESIYF